MAELEQSQSAVTHELANVRMASAMQVEAMQLRMAHAAAAPEGQVGQWGGVDFILVSAHHIRLCMRAAAGAHVRRRMQQGTRVESMVCM